MTAGFDSHASRIWQHLIQFGQITEHEALMKFGCKRLSARIKDLRDIHGERKIRTVYRKEKSRVTGKRITFTERYEYVSDDDIAAPKLGL